MTRFDDAGRDVTDLPGLWSEDDKVDAVEKKITELFHGPEPRCECCGERDHKVRWRPAYQMMLCPKCPPSGLPKMRGDQ